LYYQSSFQVVEFPDVEGPLEFGYDKEWVGVLQATHHLMSTTRQQTPLPGKLKQHIQWKEKKRKENKLN